MKKLLTFMLLICVLVSTFILASCSGVSVEAVKEDPASAITEATANATTGIFTDETNTGKAIMEALNKGAIILEIEGKDLLGEGNKLTETIYIDSENGKYASDTNVKMGEDVISALVYLGQNKLALNSNALLGSDVTYLIDITTFMEKFADSDLATLFELSESDKAELEEAFAQIKDALNKAPTDIQVPDNEIYVLLNQTVTEETVKAGEDEIDCVVVSYSLDNTTLKNIMVKYIEAAGYTEQELADIKKSLDDTFEKLEAAAKIEMTEKAYINKSENKLFKTTVLMAIEPNANSSLAQYGIKDKITLNFETVYGENDVVLTAKLGGLSALLGGASPVAAAPSANMELTAVVALTKSVTDKAVVYDLSATFKMPSIEMKLAGLTYTYTKASGNFEIEAEVNQLLMGTEKPFKATISGNITASASEAKYQLTSVEYGDEEYTFNISLTFKSVDKIPEIPADAKDIVDLTQKDIEDFMTAFEKTPLYAIIAESMQ